MVYWILVELENDIFLVFGFWLLGFSKKIFFLLFPNENYIGFHMRYHLFLHYGWFLQNIEKDFIRTNMHTTVSLHLPLFDCLVEKLVHIRWEFLLHRLSGRLLHETSNLEVLG